MSDKPDKNAPGSRADLLRVAKKIFADIGFDRATVKDLADRACVNVSAISYYFGGKEALYESCLKDFAQMQVGFADRFLKTPLSREDFKLRLRLFTEEFIQLHLKEPDLCRIIHRDFEGRNPIAMDVFKTSFFPIYKSLESFISSAKKNKILRSDIDPIMSTFFIFGMIIHIVKADPMRKEILGTSVTQPKEFDSTIDYFINIALNGILRDEHSGAQK
jgi:AcrR family transcriptional regulator